MWARKDVSRDGAGNLEVWTRAPEQENRKSSTGAVRSKGRYERAFLRGTEYVFYMDGKETWRTAAGGVCQVPLYIKFTEEIGPWSGDIATAKLPDRFLVDYVRVFERTAQTSSENASR